MSVSCVGTCSACGVRRFWLSDTLSLQLDDGSLKCLPHPAESAACEQLGLTLAQASRRGRLYRETFFVCRHCGREGETIERASRDDPLRGFSLAGAAKFSIAVIAVPLPLAVWFERWDAVLILGCMAVAAPWTAWWENHKEAAALKARGLSRPDAPGRVAVAPPTEGCMAGLVLGRNAYGSPEGPTATGPCCDSPDWRWAGSQRDEDRIPCCACGRGVMTVDELSIH